jgi:hypothetical protein
MPIQAVVQETKKEQKMKDARELTTDFESINQRRAKLFHLNSFRAPNIHYNI